MMVTRIWSRGRGRGRGFDYGDKVGPHTALCIEGLMILPEGLETALPQGRADGEPRVGRP